MPTENKGTLVMFQQVVHSDCEGLRQEPIIAIEKDQKATRAGPHSIIASGGNTLVFLADSYDFRIAGSNLRCVIIRSVIYDNYLEVWIVLLKRTFNRLT